MNKNKGFSLVELIVVIAIMAVLVGVLAPSLLAYVEKARVQKDASAVSEIVSVSKYALADPQLETLVSVGNTLTVSTTGAFSDDLAGTDNGTYADVVSSLFGAVSFSSNGMGDVTITVTSLTGTPTVAVTTSSTDATWKAAIEAIK